jgi:hypothetical protein
MVFFAVIYKINDILTNVQLPNYCNKQTHKQKRNSIAVPFLIKSKIKLLYKHHPLDQNYVFCFKRVEVYAGCQV